MVLLANHQTEADPGVFAHMLISSHPNLATDVIYVAGDRVVTDALSKPFSMGRNLFCVHRWGAHVSFFQVPPSQPSLLPWPCLLHCTCPATAPLPLPVFPHASNMHQEALHDIIHITSASDVSAPAVLH